MDKVLERIMDSDNWPCIKNAENLELLNNMADKAFVIASFESKFAGMLIYHQIVESMCLHIIENCNFYVELSLYPMTIQLKPRDGKMLGYYINELENSIDFELKSEFIDKVKIYNQYRNKIVHELTKQNIDDIEKTLNVMKTQFDGIFNLYDNIQDWFRVCFKDFKKDTFVDCLDDDYGDENNE